MLGLLLAQVSRHLLRHAEPRLLHDPVRPAGQDLGARQHRRLRLQREQLFGIRLSDDWVRYAVFASAVVALRSAALTRAPLPRLASGPAGRRDPRQRAARGVHGRLRAPRDPPQLRHRARRSPASAAAWWPSPSATSIRRWRTGPPRANSSSSPSCPAPAACWRPSSARTIFETVRSFAYEYSPNTWQMVLGITHAAGDHVPAEWAVVGVRTLRRTADMAVVLEARNLNKSFGAVTAAADINVGHRAGQRGGSDRQQRRGQDHLHQHGHRLPQARPRAASTTWSATSPACRRGEITRLGICRSFQIPQLFDNLSVYENLHVGVGIAARSGRDSAAHSERPATTSTRSSSASVSPDTAARAPAAAGRGAQAARHRHGGGRTAAPVAAGRADQRRVGRREVPADGHGDGRSRGAGRHRAFRRARHGHRQPLHASHPGLLRRPDHRGRRAGGGAAGPRGAPLRHRRGPSTPRRPACCGWKGSMSPSARSASCATSAWSFRPARFTGLIGRNGAGKTTLMRVHHGHPASRATARSTSMAATLDDMPTHRRARDRHRLHAGRPPAGSESQRRGKLADARLGSGLCRHSAAGSPRCTR